MTDNLLAEFFSHSAIDEAMQDAWNDICSDTGCHPLDITQGRGKQLTFSPNHWANQIAKRLFLRAVKVQLKADAKHEPCPICGYDCAGANPPVANCPHKKATTVSRPLHSPTGD